MALTAIWLAQQCSAAKETPEKCYHSLVQNRHVARTKQTNTQEEPQTCSLPLCAFHGPNAPKLWVDEHQDGAGHRMQNIINGMAVAQKVGMNFGGVLRKDHLTEQFVNFKDVTAKFFGAADPDVGGLFGLPRFDLIFRDPRELEGRMSDIKDGMNILMWAAHEWYWNLTVPSSLFFPAEFRKRLAAPLASQPLLFTSDKPVVAMHLRRGDLDQNSPRATPNEYYYQISDRIRELLPSAEFHVWAALKNPWGPLNWKNEDFDGFRLKGMQVHLDDGVSDGDSIIRTWAHLASANIFVASQSSFSYVPMILNCRCVIIPFSSELPLENWMNGNEESRDSYHSELTACVQRSQAPSRF